MSWYTKLIDNKQYTLWSTPEYIVISDKIRTIATFNKQEIEDLRNKLNIWLFDNIERGKKKPK